MTTIKTNVGTRESARTERFEPTGTIASTNVQKAIEEVASEAAPLAAGLPTAGTTGQALTKNSNTDYDVSWSSSAGDMSKSVYDTGNDGKIDVAAGGTGLGSYAVGDILYASGATVLSKLADVATGNALISGGVTTAPSWGKIGLTTHVSGTLGVGNGGTGLSSYTTGDLIQASGSTTLASLAAVASGNALISGGVGTVSSWGKIGLTTHVNGTLPIGNGGTNATTASAALSNLGGVATTVTISAAGLVTGGGDLSTNRTIAVTASSNTQAVAGTDTTTAVTPAALAASRQVFAGLSNYLFCA
jgi:hypothetical protein